MIVEQPTAQVIKKTWRKKSCISMCHHSGQWNKTIITVLVILFYMCLL
jgi:hypothetical protein